MRVTNRTLSTLLRGMVSKCLRDRDIKLYHVEFAYNRCPLYASSHSSFEVCYGLNPLTPLDLTSIPQESHVSFEVEEKAKELRKLHEQVKAQIEKVNGPSMVKANNILILSPNWEIFYG